MFLRSLATAACCTLLATASFAQQPPCQPASHGQRHPERQGRHHQLQLSLPRGRTIGADIVPYGEVWRTGANPATTLITAGNLKIGTLDVPAGTYTLFTLPSAKQWHLHRQQEDRRVGHPLSRRQRPRPHPHDQQAHVVLAGGHVHLL